MKSTIDIDTWSELLNNPQKISSESYCLSSKHQINLLIHNYFVVSAHKDAQESFERESGLFTESNEETTSNPSIRVTSNGSGYKHTTCLLEERNEIRQLIHSGYIEEAILKLKELDSNLLLYNKKVSFHLNRQLMIEMIRQGKVTEVLKFAREQMRYETNSLYQKEIENIMTLLTFIDSPNTAVKDLLQVDHRHETATIVNAAILESRHEESSPELEKLLKLLDWGQQQLSQKVNFPIIKNFETAELEFPEV